MHSEDTKILDLNKYHTSSKAPFVVYRYLDSSIKEIAGCKNNPEDSFRTKIGANIPSRFSKPIISYFKSMENCIQR